LAAAYFDLRPYFIFLLFLIRRFEPWRFSGQLGDSLNKKLVWIFWGLFTMALAAYYVNTFFWSDDKATLLIGATTHGHYQIEMACSACHGEAFGGSDGLQKACLSCHQEELQLADDSHPKSKFTDPRNADRVAILDARYCVTCHSEHRQQSTLAMGLTIPGDYCYYCHQETIEERPSHKELGFETCATSGCHNYHDNRALYEDFLIEHANEPILLATTQSKPLALPPQVDGLNLIDVDAPIQYQSPEFLAQWIDSAHADNMVNCKDCHQTTTAQWLEKPGIQECQECHQFQVKGFTSGKHGMRLASQLEPQLSSMTPGQARQHQFKPDSFDHAQNCNACHGAHDFNTQTAAVDSCLNCHNDQHSQSFSVSPHGQLWQQQFTDAEYDGSSVSCATCHLPRETSPSDNRVHVQHNQNANLRPNEKMIREVCMNCHGLGFAIDALADQTLIDNNFNGAPSRHVPSIDWALQRLQALEPAQQ
jgi:hypothetical protein